MGKRHFEPKCDLREIQRTITDTERVRDRVRHIESWPSGRKWERRQEKKKK